MWQEVEYGRFALIIDGRSASKIGGRWDWPVGGGLSQKLWKMEGSPKQMGVGRLAPITGYRWEVDPHNRWEMGG